MALLDKNHVCSRESCPPNHVSSNKVKCFMCSKEYFHKCVGIDNSIYDALAPNVPFESCSTIQFVCPSCLGRPKILAALPQTTLTQKVEDMVKIVKTLVVSQGIMNDGMTKIAENTESAG